MIGVAGQSRACVCCGLVTRVRMIPHDKVPRFESPTTALATTFNNICSQIVAAQNDDEEREKVLTVCIPCLNWLHQHVGHQAEISFPIYYLSQFLRCLQTRDNECFDRRTVWRLCKSLTACHQGHLNYYLVFFAPHTQHLIHRIAVQGTTTVARELALAFEATHGNVMFAPNRRLSEFLRDSLINNDLYEEEV